MNTPNTFHWQSEVRGYELDSQGIVKNANYLKYFDHVRVKHLMAKGINWSEWHRNGFDIVLATTTIDYRSPLKAHDEFYVTSTLRKEGKLKIVFDQVIIKKDCDTVIAKSS